MDREKTIAREKRFKAVFWFIAPIILSALTSFIATKVLLLCMR